MSFPGFGDEATWPAYYGHPNDPRQPDYDFDEEQLPVDVTATSVQCVVLNMFGKARIDALRSIYTDCLHYGTPEADKIAAEAAEYLPAEFLEGEE